MPGKHALISASRLKQAELCPASIIASLAYPDVSGEAAERGTRIHDLAERIMKRLDLPLHFDPEELAVAHGWCDEVKARTMGAAIYTELDVAASLRSIHPALGGTCDLVAIFERRLIVADLKTGRVPVPVLDNLQLLAYALGALKHFNITARSPIKQVTLAIYQRGWAEVTMSVTDVLAVESRLFAIADAALTAGAPFRPSPSACRYCKHLARCDAAGGEARKQERAADLAERLDAAELASAWADSVKKEGSQALTAGDKVPGWKLKPGAKRVVWLKGAEEALQGVEGAWTLATPSAAVKAGLDPQMVADWTEEKSNAPSLVREGV